MMELWTEYEGRTIDGAFPLKKLLLPEGRSAFFSTSNGKGVPTVIRLIASHFDEDEIQARWRGVEALGHPNILKFERYGQLELDDTTVVYAVFEPVDANLAEVVVDQQLTSTEARQLVSSLASAVDVLHRNGFVHEHIEPANVFAVGEVVKLRGDCIRDTPEGEKGLEAKRRDVRDIAVLLQRALTPAVTPDSATRKPLPAPFDEIVRNGFSGAWGLEQILAALRVNPISAPTATASPTKQAPAAPANAPAATAVNERIHRAKLTAEPASPRESREPRLAERQFVPPATRLPWLELERISLPPAKWLAAIGLAVVLLFWLTWRGMHHQPANQNVTTQETSPANSATNSPAGSQTGANTAAVNPALAASSSPLPAPTNAGAGLRDQWRVIAFTYDHPDAAQKKAAAIAQQHADLQPAVFTPTGHAPYLVTVGGAMSHDQAFALAHRVRRLGLPHDTYAQNYSGKP